MHKKLFLRKAKISFCLALSLVFFSSNLLACTSDKGESLDHSTQTVYEDAIYFRKNVVSLKAANVESTSSDENNNEETIEETTSSNSNSQTQAEITTSTIASETSTSSSSSSSTNSLAYRASISSFTFDEEAYNNLDQTASAYIENFSVINQNPELPTGCEVTSLTMVLNYYGYEVTNTELASNYLNTGSLRSNPYVNFVGSPFSSSSYGCYSPVIVDCATSFGANAINISYCSI